MLLKNFARLPTRLPLYYVPMYSSFSTSGSSTPPPKRFLISSMNFNRMSTTRGKNLDPFFVTFLERYPSGRNIHWKTCIIQLLKGGADVTFRQPKLKQLQELMFNIKQNRFTTFQSFNQFIIIRKSQIKQNNRLNKKNKLQQKQAFAYLKKVINEDPKSEKYQGPLEQYDVHKVKTASISKNLKNLFDKCDQHPGEYCIATCPQISDYELIDFIIAKKQKLKYHIFTFDASILRKKQRLSDAKALFAELLSRQKGKPNYIINHIALCHRDADQSMPYNPKKNFNIFCSPWDEITINSNKPIFDKTFHEVRHIVNMNYDSQEQIEQTQE